VQCVTAVLCVVQCVNAVLCAVCDCIVQCVAAVQCVAEVLCAVCAVQCVTAVEPEWLSEMGPMFFSIKDTNTGRVEQRRKEKADKALMGAEMEVAMRKKAEEAAAKQAREDSVRSRERESIVTPGRRAPGTPLLTPRRHIGL
jgi:hypothetical protein